MESRTQPFGQFANKNSFYSLGGKTQTPASILEARNGNEY